MDKFMQNALKVAHEGLKKGEVPVGCVFIYKNNIITSASNLVNVTKNATRHAEMICIDETYKYCKENSLNPDEIFREIIVIVTVEPCIMCITALNYLHIKEIIYGCQNDRFGGVTVVNVNSLLNSNMSVKGGLMSEEAMKLLKEFYKGENPSAPNPKKKLN